MQLVLAFDEDTAAVVQLKQLLTHAMFSISYSDFHEKPAIFVDFRSPLGFSDLNSLIILIP